jgi:hypothetical protein
MQPVMDTIRISGTGPALVFPSRSGFHVKTANRFCRKTRIQIFHENRIAIFPERFLIAIVIAIANAGTFKQFPQVGIKAAPAFYLLFKIAIRFLTG